MKKDAPISPPKTAVKKERIPWHLADFDPIWRDKIAACARIKGVSIPDIVKTMAEEYIRKHAKELSVTC